MLILSDPLYVWTFVSVVNCCLTLVRLDKNLSAQSDSSVVLREHPMLEHKHNEGGINSVRHHQSWPWLENVSHTRHVPLTASLIGCCYCPSHHLLQLKGLPSNTNWGSFSQRAQFTSSSTQVSVTNLPSDVIQRVYGRNTVVWILNIMLANS